MREHVAISAEELYSTIPLLPELEHSFPVLLGSTTATNTTTNNSSSSSSSNSSSVSGLVIDSSSIGGNELGMEGLRRAMLATDGLEETSVLGGGGGGGGVGVGVGGGGGCCGVGVGVGGGVGLIGSSPSPLRHDPSLHYETEPLQLSDTADLCRLSQLRLQSSTDPILHDNHVHLMGDDPHEAGVEDVMYTELTSHYREFSPGSTGDCGLEPELSDSGSSESGLKSPSSVGQWDSIGDCGGVSITMDPDGPLPPVSDIFTHRLNKEDYGDLFLHRSLPLHIIKTERADSEEDSMDCSFPRQLQQQPYSSSSSSCFTTSSSCSPLLSYATLQPHTPRPKNHPHHPNNNKNNHYHHNNNYLPTTINPSLTLATTTTTTNNNNNKNNNRNANNNNTTTNNSNYHDYTCSVSREEEEEEEGRMVMEESSTRSGRHLGGVDGEMKGQRKKPGRKKGQVSKVLHLWEFIRDLLSDPNYCPRIISWENEREGVFRVLHSSEVARLWGEKKKNKKTMTYEKLSRSLRYSRKEGYFDDLPRDRGYPKKLCFKFGPKSHGWREFRDNR
ncbi:uncharacterized protein LOC143301545 isoform X2 [Babylonia areolata]|uniref:uncharacterized protein LOC143301545 isoform X2 n=1 Tax=Babylonia areolata TaxID=304850 RepID=UPI003FCFABBE